MNDLKQDECETKTETPTKRKGAVNLNLSGAMIKHFRRTRTKRAQRVLDAHYRNLLAGGRLIVVRETSRVAYHDGEVW
jgi:hypothetical protein